MGLFLFGLPGIMQFFFIHFEMFFIVYIAKYIKTQFQMISHSTELLIDCLSKRPHRVHSEGIILFRFFLNFMDDPL